jgi:hypothetical protein
VKFILFVEGYTERDALPRFFKSWLDPELRDPVGIQSARLDEWTEGRRRFTRVEWADVLLRAMGYEPTHPDFTENQRESPLILWVG